MLLLLRMYDTCVARVCRSPVRINGMHRTQSDHTSLDPLSLVIQSNQACFDHQIRETYTKHSVGAKTWPGKPVNLVPESHFPFVQISSSYPTTAAKARNWYQRWLWWKGTRILVWKTFHLEKQDFLFICSFALRNFPLERTKKSRSIYFPTGISGNFLSYLTFDC